VASGYEPPRRSLACHTHFRHAFSSRTSFNSPSTLSSAQTVHFTTTSCRAVRVAKGSCSYLFWYVPNHYPPCLTNYFLYFSDYIYFDAHPPTSNPPTPVFRPRSTHLTRFRTTSTRFRTTGTRFRTTSTSLIYLPQRTAADGQTFVCQG
jgi:hypothetical protein